MPSDLVPFTRRGPTRVLMVERGGSGGIAQYSHALCGELAAAGLRVELLSPPRQALPPTGAAYVLREQLTLNIGHGRVGALAREARNAAVGVGVGWWFRPDVVVLQMPAPGRLDEPWLRALQRMGARIVWVGHDLAGYEWGGTLKPFARRLYSGVDAYVTLSDAERQKLLTQLPELSLRTSVIPHGDFRYLVGRRVDRDEARHALGLVRGRHDADSHHSLPAVDDDAPVALFFGYLKPYKGLDDLVDALALLHADGVRVRAVFAGKPDPGADAELRRRADAAGIGDDVMIRAGYVPNEALPELFGAADFVVQPYREATQSGVTQLAYAFGRPVVVTDAGGLAEDVAPGVTGEVATAGDPASIAGAIRRLLADRAALASMQEQLEQAAPERNSWQHVTDEYLALFDRLLPGGVRRA